MELTELFELFLEERKAAGLAANTLAWYGYQLSGYHRWLTEVGERNILERRTIERFLNARRDAGLQPNSVAGAHRALRVFYGWLVERSYIPASPVAAVKIRKTQRKVPRRALLEDYERLLNSIEPSNWVDLRDRFLIKVLFLCGVRVGEAVALAVDDVDVRSKLLAVNRGKTGGRLVPLLPAVIDEFIAYIYARPGGAGASERNELLLSAHGDLSVRGVITTNGVRQMLRRRCLAAGIPYLNPHSFRHGLAMYLLNRGGDMSMAQRILGHSRIQTTAENYAQWITEDLSREFAEKMNGVNRSDK